METVGERGEEEAQCNHQTTHYGSEPSRFPAADSNGEWRNEQGTWAAKGSEPDWNRDIKKFRKTLATYVILICDIIQKRIKLCERVRFVFAYTCKIKFNE